MMTILVATDLSSEALLAQERAELLADQLDANLRIVHIAQERNASLSTEPQREDHRVAAANRDKRETLQGDPCEVICDLSKSVDLLVLGEPRRRTTGELFTGTTGQQIISRSMAPALLVRNAALNPYRRVLLAVDLSPQSTDIMQTSKALMLTSADCWTLHAYETPQVNLMVQASSFSVNDIQKHITAERRRFRKKLNAQMRKAGLTAKAEALPVKASPATTILNFAMLIEADLIIMGSRRRSNLAKLLLGSVAADVLSRSQADVLIVPPV